MAQTKTEKVYDQLLNHIIKGVIRPGSRLIISQMAKEFNVSEIPVREVIQRLAHEGYITLNPHTGPTVKSLSDDDVRQIFEIRANLESMAARLAVDHISNANIKELELLLEESNLICENEDFEGYLQINNRFHGLLYQHSNNEMLIKMINELTSLAARYPSYFRDKETVQVSIKEHEDILNALIKRDADLIEQTTKKHLLKVIPKLTKLVRETNAQMEYPTNTKGMK